MCGGAVFEVFVMAELTHQIRLIRNAHKIPYLRQLE
jgi:hypothetical protein